MEIFLTHKIVELSERIHMRCSEEFRVHINMSALNVSPYHLVILCNTIKALLFLAFWIMIWV